MKRPEQTPGKTEATRALHGSRLTRFVKVFASQAPGRSAAGRRSGIAICPPDIGFSVATSSCGQTGIQLFMRGDHLAHVISVGCRPVGIFSEGSRKARVAQ